MANLLQNIGPVSATFYDVTAGTDLGKTEGDVSVTFTEEFAETYNDQDGVGPVDGVITGFTMEVVTPFSQMDVTNLDKLLSNSTVTAQTGQDGKLSVSAGVGRSMYDNAYPLHLARYVDGVASSDQDDIIKVLKAFPIVNAELVYGKETQRVVNVTWKCFPSQATADLGVYFRIGEA